MNCTMTRTPGELGRMADLIERITDVAITPMEAEHICRLVDRMNRERLKKATAAERMRGGSA